MEGAGTKIEQAVSEWEGVTSFPHRFGGVEFRLGRVELGHIHGDRLADLPFPTKVRDELIAQDRAKPHHVLPNSGWVSRTIVNAADVDDVIELFRMNYERLTARRGKKTAAE